MLKNYISIAFNSLFRNKTFSLVNILGLTAGTICCLYILLYIKDQYSFDDHHKAADRIFRITTDIISSEKTDRLATVSPIIPLSARKDFPEVEEVTRVIHRADVDEHLFRTGDKSIYITRGYYADSNFFKVFNYRFTEGTTANCLDKPMTMVISSEVARKLFGNETAVNMRVNMTDRFGTDDYLITGVFDENFERSHIRPNFIMNIYSGRMGRFTRMSADWAYDNYAHGYIVLKQGANAKEFESKLTSYVNERGKEHLKAAGYTKLMHLQPVRYIHVTSKLGSELDKNSNSRFLFILLIIAAFIQLIACINFMNLSTARSTRRAKEIGVRKTAGAGKSSLVKQFLIESFVMATIAIGLALPLLYLLLPFFNQLSQYDLSTDIFQYLFTWQLIIGLIICTGLLAGSYPAFYLSSFRTIEVLKGNFRHHLSSVSLRKGLVVFQFMISVGLIIAVVIIDMQVKYMRGKELGFDQKQKLIIHIRSREAIRNVETIKTEIAKLSEVRKAAGILYYFGFKIEEDVDLYRQDQNLNDAKRILYNHADENYFEAMSIPLVAGRNFTKADTLRQIIINETAAKELGIGIYEAPGKILYIGGDSNRNAFTIIGVLKDFNFASLHEKIKPIFFRYNYRYPNIIVSSNTTDYESLISKLQSVWKQLNPQEPFQYTFLDDNIQKQYESENTLLRIINSFSILAIFICCLGLFGLAAFTAEQRVKEIGVRKVLGATTSNLVALLSKDFLKLVLIACIITMPLAWWAMNDWLQEFAYRISISWWIFVLAGIFALLITLITVGLQAVKAASANPVKNLRTE